MPLPLHEAAPELVLLPHEPAIIDTKLAKLALDQAAVADRKNESMNQSSETWHDNNAADDANNDSLRVSGVARSLQKLAERATVEYPDAASPVASMGSVAVLGIWDTRVAAALVGEHTLYEDSDFDDFREVEETIILGLESPIASALIGLAVGESASFESDGRTFNFSVESINQTFMRQKFASLVQTTAD